MKSYGILLYYTDDDNKKHFLIYQRRDTHAFIYLLRKAHIMKPYEIKELNGIVLTLEAFRVLFFGLGDYLLIFMISIFGISTLLTYSYYGVKCYGFLTKPEQGKYYNIIYIIAIIFSECFKITIVPKYNSLSIGGGSSYLFSLPALPLFLE